MFKARNHHIIEDSYHEVFHVMCILCIVVYLQAQAEAEGQGGDSDDDLKAAAAKARTIDPLAPVDHSAIQYDEFAKDFYTEHPTIAAMTEQQVRYRFFLFPCEAACLSENYRTAPKALAAGTNESPAITLFCTYAIRRVVSTQPLVTICRALPRKAQCLDFHCLHLLACTKPAAQMPCSSQQLLLHHVLSSCSYWFGRVSITGQGVPA